MTMVMTEQQGCGRFNCAMRSDCLLQGRSARLRQAFVCPHADCHIRLGMRMCRQACLDGHRPGGRPVDGLPLRLPGRICGSSNVAIASGDNHAQQHITPPAAGWAHGQHGIGEQPRDSTSVGPHSSVSTSAGPCSTSISAPGIAWSAGRKRMAVELDLGGPHQQGARDVLATNRAAMELLQAKMQELAVVRRQREEQARVLAQHLPRAQAHRALGTRLWAQDARGTPILSGTDMP